MSEDLELLLKKLSEMGSHDFFRGQPNAEWSVVPKIFRCELMSKEYYRGEKYSPEESWVSLYKNQFRECYGQPNYNILCDMQHYGAYTRLIDWSKNSLVALFFACNTEKGKDGRVFYSDWQSSNEDLAKLYFDIFSEIAMTDSVDGLIEIILWYFSRYLFLMKAEVIKKLDYKHRDYWISQEPNFLEKQLNRFIHSNSFKELLITKISDDNRISFCHFIYGLGDPWFLCAPRLNERVIAQRGAFNINSGKVVGNEIIIKATIFNPESILIKSSEKEIILYVLDKNFGINAETLCLENKEDNVLQLKESLS